ncbi:GNAT family N-acetyltransferase [Mitsuaria sp. WAJ17]|uniref:GNAT family N-acetyltransferase n=1 Tax=Mitsuaria sp. WAJ17 TaxID=2761452 RepID=UPI0015FED8B1|nr:GNAT family N-acetyltransferase [Mitsuaria sp. WAJ17]MBB2484265.1 GNAT family N-acetyltransferase [Mitsuaria sp. WAJ17]
MPELREARAQDLPALSQLISWVWLQTYADQGVRPAFAGHLQDTFSPVALQAWLQAGHRCWLVEDAGHLQGMIHVSLDSCCPVAWQDGPEAEVSELYVVPPLSRHGLGRALLAHAREQLPDRALWLSVWAPNERAIAFYEREQGRRLGETWFELDRQRHLNWIYGWLAQAADRGA